MVLRFAAALAAIAVTTVVGFQAQAAELGSTAWRLVQIMSMNDTVDTPDDRSKYTLEFQADGRVAILADCNRGTGSWTSQSDYQLQFGPIAATRAMCPPQSISDNYLGQFEWVRSYVMKDGHLFLATMADGSIIEFEPIGEVTATVLGEDIRASDAHRMQEAILTKLFDRFADEQGIEVAPEEIETYLEKMRQGTAEEDLTEDQDLSDEEAKEVSAMRRTMAQSLIRQWKINRALYEKYGGRVIYQQFGPEPLDAYRQALEEWQRNGAFDIHETAMADEFWRYFTDDQRHDFMQPGSTDEKNAFSVPPWDR